MTFKLETQNLADALASRHTADILWFLHEEYIRLPAPISEIFAEWAAKKLDNLGYGIYHNEDLDGG